MLHPRNTRTVRVCLLCALPSLLLALLLVGCGGKTSDSKQRVLAIEFTELEPTPSSCDIVDISTPAQRKVGTQDGVVTEAYGSVFVEYLAIDFPASFVDIVPEYSTNGGVTWRPATAGISPEGDISRSASQLGDQHIWVWDTIADLPGSLTGPVTNVVFRITTVEVSQVGPLFGDPCLSNVFEVLNQAAQLDLGSIATGLAQVSAPQTDPPDPNNLTIGVSLNLTDAMDDEVYYSATLDVVYDSSLITIIGAEPAFLPVGVAPAGSQITEFTELGPGRVRVTVQSPTVEPDPLNPVNFLPEGRIINLLIATACAPPRPLPASAAIVCDNPSATDLSGNELAVDCGVAGAVSIIDNTSLLTMDDFSLTVGSPPFDVPLNLTVGTPPVPSDEIVLTLSYDPALLLISGVTPVGATGATLDDPGTGLATLTITNPQGVPFVDGTLVNLAMEAVAAMDVTTFLTLGNLQMVIQPGAPQHPCSIVGGSLGAPGLDVLAVEVQISSTRGLVDVRALHALGATGTPAMVPGSDVDGNPKGDWAPLNEGIFSDVISLQAGGNPVIFFDVADPPFQVMIEAEFTGAPITSDATPATSVDGSTVYSVLSGAGFVDIDAGGLLTPLDSNGCTIFRATFTPNGTTSVGAPMAADFAACVDLGGIDASTRTTLLPVGNLDADIPGLPLGDVLPGAGGTVTESIYVNTGASPIGAYQTVTTWNDTILALDTGIGTQGLTGPSWVALGGPTVVNAGVSGQATANHFTTAMTFIGVFDIWTLHFDVLSAGNTALDHEIVSLVSSDLPPVDIGPPTPRPAPEASTSPGGGITFP